MAEKKKKAEQGGHNYHTEGGIHAGRDVIMGDQHNRIVHRDDNRIISLVQHNPTPAGLVSALHEVRKELVIIKETPGLNGAQTRTVETALAQVEQAAAKAAQPEPPGNDILADLRAAKETIDLLAGSLASAAGLGVIVANLITLAGQVLGIG